MALETYNKKRRFDETAEPEGKSGHSKGRLKFVIQKHDASHLHYDFRLEMDGAMKSWAVPKGPSLNPEEKHLAVMVEDHPLSYNKFEGTIPEGNYGGGTVMVWDEGTYEVPGTKNRKESEKQALEGLDNGTLHLVLHGEKLKGGFMLFRFKKAGEKSWLLTKKEDEFSTTENVLDKDMSVKTGRSLDEIAEDK
jgi:bifunctional non-homologous end joining protein LigD